MAQPFPYHYNTALIMLYFTKLTSVSLANKTTAPTLRKQSKPLINT